MFTGIIHHIGTVMEVQRSAVGSQLTVSVAGFDLRAGMGESICINGVCLTVVESKDTAVAFDVIEETLRRSTLGTLRTGDRVNVERSLRVGDPMDGHFVQGHVDGVARVREISTGNGREHLLRFDVDQSLYPVLVPKGSVSVDGVSLTIAESAPKTFSVALIPTTLKLTTLGDLRPGDQVNIETDVVSRTAVHAIKAIGGESSLSIEQLISNGFA